ncbi:uncharacterized protein [Rhodnius prolixus]|uniref:Chitin-binding type-2 domain-containing protein n=2 Tax=Rhodnius prolixus TaxID=13249 RepID=T1HFZ1_RHOPR
MNEDFMMIKLGLLLACVFTISLAYKCDPRIKEYNWPNSKDCQSYYHCVNGTATEDKCVTLFRKFNRETLKCDWTWKVNCSAEPHLPVPDAEEVKPKDPPAEPSEPAHEYVPHQPDPVPERSDSKEVKPKDPPAEPSEPAHEYVPHQPDPVPERPDSKEVKPKDPPAEPSEPAHEYVPHQPDPVPERPDSKEVKPKDPPAEPSEPAHEYVPHQPDPVPESPVNEVDGSLYPA